MAFYSVRIDDNGKEIETTRQTYRKFFNDTCGDAASVKGTDQDFQARQTCRSPINTFKTVRYVNSATFIEKDHDPVKKQLSDQEEEPNESDDVNSDTFDFSVDVNEQQYQSHIATDKFNESVPVLELNSNESFPSSNNLTYSYRRVCEVTKIIQKPDAYKEWLDAKRTALMYQREMKKKRKQEEEKAKEERKRMAEEKFNEWLARKAKTKVTEQAKYRTQQTAPKKESLTDIKYTLKVDKPEPESNFNAWLEQKKQQEKAQKEKINQDLKREEELKSKRKQESANVYENWLKTAPQKPKPVPLNQGLFTLKGSLSQIYVNPVPWVSTDPDDGSKSM